jgi:hypothetical protein
MGIEGIGRAWPGKVTEATEHPGRLANADLSTLLYLMCLLFIAVAARSIFAISLG